MNRTKAVLAGAAFSSFLSVTVGSVVFTQSAFASEDPNASCNIARSTQPITSPIFQPGGVCYGRGGTSSVDLPVNGRVDSCDDNVLAGWARDDDSEDPIQLDIYEGSRYVGSAFANLDSEPAVGGNGHHRFVKPISELDLSSGAHTLTTYALGIDKNGNKAGNNPIIYLSKDPGATSITCYR